MSIRRHIPLGIGDIFIIRLICDAYQNKINDDLEINLRLISDYRDGNKKYSEFIISLLQHLFKDRKIYIIDIDYNSKITPLYSYIDNYNFVKDCTNIRKHFNLSPILNEKYIIFHTKSRFDGLNDKQYSILFDVLKNHFKSYKTDYKIVLLGERTISNNLETRIHNIKSIYDVLKELKTNNDVLDLTEEELYNTPNIEKFFVDLRYIANAEMNFGIGWGGNFALAWGTTHNFCFFINYLNHKLIDFFINENIGYLYRSLDLFINKLNEFKSNFI